jgi:DNA-binding beta-propeller fold protein YncE
MKRVIRWVRGAAVVCVVLTAFAPAAASGVPAKTTFTTPPTATRLPDGACRIDFAVSVPTDVEVAVLDKDGRVVRHLVAGMLGPNAPAPLAKDALTQSLTWDGKDDRGRAVAAGPCSVRVRLGSSPRLDRHVGWNGNTLEGAVVALAVGPKGEVFVLSSSGHGRTSLRVFDRTGRYARTIIPYPAATPKERTASVGHLEVDGERLPIVFNAHGGNTLPLTAGMKPQSMAVSPKGYLILASAVGTMSEHRPPRYLLAVHPEGGAPPETGYVGPQIRGLADRGIGFLGGAGEAGSPWFTGLATSPDGEFIYVTDTGRTFAGKVRHAVYRLRWNDRTPGPPRRGKQYMDTGPDDLVTPFLGEFGVPGADDKHFNNPQGLAVDPKGNLYVCDHGNNRVVVFDAAGALLGPWPVEKPEQIAVHPKTGAVYVLSRDGLDRRSPFAPVLRKFTAFEKGAAPTVLATLKQRIDCFALDAEADPTVLWASAGGLVQIADAGNELRSGKPVDNSDGLRYPGFVTGDPDRNRVLVREMLTGMGSKPIRTIDLATGRKEPFLSGTDTAIDAQGNIYCLGPYASNVLFRYDTAGKPLPFSDGTNKMETGAFRSYGPDLGVRGLTIAPNGDLYFVRSNNSEPGIQNRVDVFTPDGQVRRRNFIDGMQAGDCGIGVDAAGNVYLGVNVKPKDQPLPTAFAGKALAQTWEWWRFDRQGPRDVPWAYTYQNAYLNDLGAVMKFGPGGGAFYGFYVKPQKPTTQPVPVVGDVQNAPEGAGAVWSANLKNEAKVVGAVWRYGGVGPVPGSDFGWGDPGCVCWNSRLAVDPYGRVFAPNVFRFGVEMLDTNGNLIGRLGRYGNSDDAGLAFAWPAYIGAAGGKVFVSDPTNRRVTVIDFTWQAEQTCAAPGA